MSLHRPSLAQRISMISGVAQVDVIGSQKYAVRVQLDPNQMAARQIGIDDVVNAIQRGNVDLPVGTLYAPNRAYTLVSDAQLTNAAAYGPMVVTYRNGAPVRIQDIGKAIDGVENDQSGELVQRQEGCHSGSAATTREPMSCRWWTPSKRFCRLSASRFQVPSN